VSASAGTNGPCTNTPVAQIAPCVLLLSPPLLGHRRTLATLCWKYGVDSGGRMGSLRAVRFPMVAMCSARSSVSASHPEEQASSTTSVGWHQGCVWTVSMSELMYLGFVLAYVTIYRPLCCCFTPFRDNSQQAIEGNEIQRCTFGLDCKHVSLCLRPLHCPRLRRLRQALARPTSTHRQQTKRPQMQQRRRLNCWPVCQPAVYVARTIA
jgi:hypothetical protein